MLIEFELTGFKEIERLLKELGPYAVEEKPEKTP
jgi:hypothetical protein